MCWLKNVFLWKRLKGIFLEIRSVVFGLEFFMYFRGIGRGEKIFGSILI